jgi:DNA helicase-2/ATP-dependent DNA helicase PcrA
MLNPKRTTILFGPPGTGKTTELLRIVEDAIASGMRPDNIAFIAFTRKAAREALERACDKFSLVPDDLPWFRTLHSLAFEQLGLDSKRVMQRSDYLTLCSQLGISITTKGVSEDGTFQGLSKGDRLFFMENMARARMMPLREYWESLPDEHIYWYELELLHNTLLEYKTSRNKADFTDIIVRFSNGEGVRPEIQLLVVDESQDLSPLQWKMVERMAEEVPATFIAGDDDQAIFRWAGADVDKIIEMEGNKHVLNQSYRVPKSIQCVATALADRILKRVPKEWSPREAPGVVERATEIHHCDFSTGTWLLLARNSHLLHLYTTHCLQEGFVFDSPVESPIRGEVFPVIKIWEALRSGEEIRARDAKKVYELISRKHITHGYKKRLEALDDGERLTWQSLHDDWGLTTQAPWHEALDRISATERSYFLAAINRGERLLDRPRIKISTIHSVKGGEAENVCLLPDMADRTWQEFERNPDDEHRVWYVAVTRAKERLVILEPLTSRYYDLRNIPIATEGNPQ